MRSEQLAAQIEASQRHRAADDRAVALQICFEPEGMARARGFGNAGLALILNGWMWTVWPESILDREGPPAPPADGWNFEMQRLGRDAEEELMRLARKPCAESGGNRRKREESS
jgi:hypothetical protein